MINNGYQTLDSLFFSIYFILFHIHYLMKLSKKNYLFHIHQLIKLSNLRTYQDRLNNTAMGCGNGILQQRKPNTYFIIFSVSSWNPNRSRYNLSGDVLLFYQKGTSIPTWTLRYAGCSEENSGVLFWFGAKNMVKTKNNNRSM